MQKAILIGLGFLIWTSGIIGGCVYLYKQGGVAAVNAYKLEQEITVNAELRRLTKERDDAYTILSAQKKAIAKVQGDNPPVGPRSRHIYHQLLCDRDPTKCAKGFAPTVAGK